MESVLRKAGVHCNATIFEKSVQLLVYADDIDIIGLPSEMQLLPIERESTKMGLPGNKDKTKCMLSTSRDSQRE